MQCRLIDREIFAIIRRIDTDGDAKICFDEFADFFCNQVNAETPMHKVPNGNQTKKNPKAPPSKHRSFEFETPSRGNRAVQQLIEDMAHRQGIFAYKHSGFQE